MFNTPCQLDATYLMGSTTTTAVCCSPSVTADRLARNSALVFTAFPWKCGNEEPQLGKDDTATGTDSAEAVCTARKILRARMLAAATARRSSAAWARRSAASPPRRAAVGTPRW